jgi:N4-gp56 family major capsid protein
MDIILGGSTDSGAGQQANQILTAYQRKAFFALREGVIFDQFAKVKPGDLTSPGNPVNFLFRDDLAQATTPLNEIVDVDAVGMSDSSVQVTPQEHGNAVVLTIRLRTDNYTLGYDADVANILAYNLVDTTDELARDAIDAGGTETYPGAVASEAAIVAGNVLTVADSRRERVQLRNASVMPWDISNYMAITHPDTGYDLKSETGDGAWSTVVRYNDAIRVYNDEIGQFGGLRWIESPRCLLNPDGGDTNVDTYTTYFFGQEFLAKAESIPPHMVMGPVTDKLRRLQPLGWHFYSGWAGLRSAALQRLITSSSIGDNA